MSNPWAPCPHVGTLHFDAASLAGLWNRLHRGDAEPLPDNGALMQGWVLFHNGEFQQAAEWGHRLGGPGLTLANKATCIHANYVEPSEPLRLERLQAAAACAQAQQINDPDNPNAWYWQGYAIGRYSQGISVAKALARGLGSQVRRALERTIALAPTHADAHLALASFHAEVIHKVGALIGSMTYGASKEAGLTLYQKAMALNPESAITQAEFAHGLVMLEGDASWDRATELLQRAADVEPLDAMEHLYVDSARMALQG